VIHYLFPERAPETRYMDLPATQPVNTREHRVPNWVKASGNGAAQNLMVQDSRAETYARLISGWIQSPAEFAWLGEDPGQFATREAAVKRWHKEGPGAYVLVRMIGDSFEPLAFANVQRPSSADQTQLELGRLVVAPKSRNNGLGRLFVDHLAKTVSADVETRTGLTINARSSKNNEIAKKLFQKSILKPVKRPKWAKTTQYEWWALQNSTKARFAHALKQLRESRKVTQGALAKEINIKRPSLSQFENANHPALPSYGTLQKLVGGLHLTRNERAELMLSFIGDKVEDLVFTESLDEELDRSDRYKVALWIISSDIAEATDDQILAESAKALSEGYARYFFVPRGQTDETDRRVMVPLRKALESKRGAIRDQLDDGSLLRLYAAPSTLCSMRVAIKNPRMHRLEDASADEVSVLAPKGKRIALDKEAASDFVRVLARVVSELDRNPKSEVEGFSRLHGIESNALVKKRS
jgi:transcriptional regulator with XRE-family HTH domain/GNAT superfamily N-acetyltransferase